MIVIRPTEINDGNLTATNVDESSVQSWVFDTAYAIGARVVKQYSSLWSSRVAPDGLYRSIAFGNDVWVAASVGGGVMRSTDNGVTWDDTPTTPEANQWRSIATDGAGNWVAVSDDGTNRGMYSSDDGATWASSTISSSSWFGVTWGGSVFVAVGSSVAATSPTGATFTGRTITLNDWRAVTYSSDLSLFAAVAITGTGTRFETSPDGITWTNRVSTEDNVWISIAAGDGEFVAIAQDGVNSIATSPDGTTWTARKDFSGFNAWTGISYGNGEFVAVSFNGGPLSMSSRDKGVTWTARDIGDDPSLRGIAHGNNLFLAVSTTASQSVFGSKGNHSIYEAVAATTGDWPDEDDLVTPVNWARVSSTNRWAMFSDQLNDQTDDSGFEIEITPAAEIDSMAFFNLVAETVQVVVDDDVGAENWTARNVPSTPVNSSITFGNNLFVAVSSSGGTVSTSTDAVTWVTAAISSVDYTNLITYSEQIDNAAWTSQNTAVTANAIAGPDGTTTADEVLDDTANTVHIVFNSTPGTEANYVASVYAKKKDNRYFHIQCSTVNGDERHGLIFDFDTETITDTEDLGSPTFTNEGFEDIGDGWYRLFASCSSSSSSSSDVVFNAIAISDSATPTYAFAFPTYAGTGTGAYVWGAQLEIGTTPGDYVKTEAAQASGNVFDREWNSIAYDNDVYVAVSGTGIFQRAMTSPNGTNWTIRDTPNNSWSSVIYDGSGTWVAVGITGSSRAMYSTDDGVTWTTSPITSRTWRGITFGAGLFVAVASSGTGDRVETSPNGITWTSRTSAADNDWRAVTFGDNLFVAVARTGSSNRVMTSADGITWTIRTSAADNEWLSVAFVNNGVTSVYVAVSQTGSGDRIMTSVNGTTWATRQSPEENSYLGITVGLDLYVSISSDGTNRAMTCPTGDISYNTTHTLEENFLLPGVRQDTLAVLDLPVGHPNSTITITFVDSTGNTKCGRLTIGRQQLFGETNHGSNIGIDDFSKKERDTFGNPVIIQRNYAKRGNFNTTILTADSSAIEQTLALLRTTPSAFIASVSIPASIIYGFYNDFNIILAPNKSVLTMEIEGLT